MTAGLQRVLVYGANGYTGTLIAGEAVRRGLAPVLAGRSRDAVDALAQRLGLRSRTFGLDDAAAIARGLDGIDLLLNCAGPFSRTAAPLLEACLERRVHYLDITGEIDVFAHCHRADARARERGIVVAPGAGFDVVPTDGVAALLKRALPAATSLVLAFEAGGGTSPGTAKTSVEGLARGGRARIGGQLVDVPLAWKTRTFVRDDGVERSATTIPWGDLYTAYVSTGIPDIEVYLALPPRAIRSLRRLRLVRPLLRFAPLRAWLEARAGARPGPDAQRRATTQCRIWGEARDADGTVERMQLVTPNGYALTATCALDIAARVLAHAAVGGYRTPSQLMGADYVLGVPGVRVVAASFDLDAAR